MQEDEDLDNINIHNYTNYISKQRIYNEYEFPDSTDDKMIIKASPSGVGYISQYDPDFEEVMDEEPFKKEITKVT